MRISKNLHTITEDIPTAVKYMRKGIGLINSISEAATIKLVTKLFCKPVRVKIKARHQKWYQTGTTDVLNIQGYQVKVLRKGSGKAVYVAHGWNSCGYAMRHIVDALVNEGYQVIMPDMPCHGRSSGVFVNQIQMSKVIEEILLHYNAQSPIEQIVTYSWGGTATLLALDRIRQQRRIGFNIKRMVSLSMPSTPEAILGIFIKTLALPKAVAKGLRRNIAAVAEADGRSLEQAFPIGLNKLFEREPFGYMLLHGTADSAISSDNSETLAKKYTHLNTRFYEGLGHHDIVKDTNVILAVINHLAGKTTAAPVFARKVAVAF